jgi:hypothetical protein
VPRTCALRTDRREVVADAAAAPHGLGGLRERRVDARAPSVTSVTESPTGWTKQLMSVAARSVPAAELIRPAGTKPCCCASRNFASQCARLVFRLGLRRARGRHGDATSPTVRFTALGVLLDQYFAGNFLLRQAGDFFFFGQRDQIDLLHVSWAPPAFNPWNFTPGERHATALTERCGGGRRRARSRCGRWTRPIARLRPDAGREGRRAVEFPMRSTR